MVREVLDALKPAAGQSVLDATVGAGGHAAALLERILPEGRLLGIDADPEMAALARRRLARFGAAVSIVVANFREAGSVIDATGWAGLDGAIFDLGLSSVQIDSPARGFSFKADGPLDMRFNRSEGRPASHFVNEMPERDLEQVLRSLGEEPRARQIARAIGEARARNRIESTLELREIVSRAAGASRGPSRTDPATRTFQALRILVNFELDSLPIALEAVFSRLKAGGRMAVISFHSLEDRIVKNFFVAKSREDLADIVIGKPLRPLAEERSSNRRSRSALLRVVERKRT